MFLSAGVFLEATTQKNSEKLPYLNVQEYSREYMTKFLHSKRVACPVYNKSLKFYGRALQQRSYPSEAVPRRRLQNRCS